MSGNNEKLQKSNYDEYDIKPEMPACTNCGERGWVQASEAWEKAYLTVEDNVYYLTTGDELEYGDVQTPWMCQRCFGEATYEISETLNRIKNRWAEWIY